jgi:hypothetical protein
VATRRKRSQETEEAILRAIEDGTPVKQAAAQAGGVNASTLYRWRMNDPEFDLRVQRARAVFLHRQIARIDDAASGDWRAAAWMLERSDPGNWGKRVEIDVQVDAQPVRDLLTGEVLGMPSLPEGEDEEGEDF